MLEENRNCGCMAAEMPVTTNSCECERDCEREKMIMEIRELGFSVLELALYLDTHPNCQKALCLHNKYSKKLHDLRNTYQKIYGPLSLDYPCNKWRWLEEPWPWERGNY